ncbi:MAG: hypothetical protein U0Z26_17130 [Anaerolineales bacterium]
MKSKKHILFLVAIVSVFLLYFLGKIILRVNLSVIYSRTMLYDSQQNNNSSGNYCSNPNLNFVSETNPYPTFMKDDWQKASKSFPQLQKTTWENFLRANSRSHPFPENLYLGCDYTLIDIKEKQTVPPEATCTNIYRFSQVGFNIPMNQALVFLSKSCGDFSYGNLYFLELIQGQWTVMDAMNVFIT